MGMGQGPKRVPEKGLATQRTGQITEDGDDPSGITKDTSHTRRTPLTAAAEMSGSELTYRTCLPGFTSLCRSNCEVSLS